MEQREKAQAVTEENIDRREERWLREEENGVRATSDRLPVRSTRAPGTGSDDIALGFSPSYLPGIRNTGGDINPSKRIIIVTVSTFALGISILVVNRIADSSSRYGLPVIDITSETTNLLVNILDNSPAKGSPRAELDSRLKSYHPFVFGNCCCVMRSPITDQGKAPS